tara:strand:+ start:1057 stop:3006 length:1950 start_codon:yes stop_codon:yes gene_type:complete
MSFTQFANLDFTEIKAQIKDYLRSNSNFSDFDFEGSNFSVLIDTLAYNTYINAFNANLVANETFLDSAVIRENVVSLARNIGYVPRSKSAARATISFNATSANSTQRLYLKPGLVCVGEANDTTYRFSTVEPHTASLVNGTATFTDIEILQGTLLEKSFIINTSKDQRYILSNSDIDANTIKVYVSGPADTGIGREFAKIDNILNINKNSEIFFIQEVQDEKYEILFGDGYFGKKLENGSKVTVRYVITDGEEGNGAGGKSGTVGNFDFAGVFTDKTPNDINALTVIPDAGISVTTVQNASNGAEVEDLSSIKYFAPRLYSAQYRAVTARDYEAIIASIYTRTESVAVVGGEELDPPQFGKVQISIKPKNGTYVSDFDKQQIKNKLKSYSIAGINADIIDLKVLYVELDSTIYYNSAKVSNSNNLKSTITSTLTDYSKNIDINKFGGRFKYSKALQLIDRVDSAITSNITKVKIRRDMKVLVNQFAQYELCFGNRFHINPEGFNIKSTGFKVSGSDEVVFLTDVPNKNDKGDLDGSHKGVLSAISRDKKNELRVIVKSIGTVDYKKGEILLNTINITETNAVNDIVEIQAFPDSNDVIGLKDLYLSFDVSNTTINMVKDVIASGEDVSGVVFSRDYYTSSYSNGKLERE